MKRGIILSLLSLLLYLGFAQEDMASEADELEVSVSSYDAHLSWENRDFPQDAYFRIERAESGHSFELLECIPASEINADGNRMTFTDANVRFLVGPVVRYRLSWVDQQGDIHQGPTASIQIDPH